MNSDPGILCFQHCDCSIYCRHLPQFCPLCNTELSTSIDTIPFRVPYPFIRASQSPCSIVLKPSRGNFLNSYAPNDDLHIGLTDSHSIVFEYDVDGMCYTKTGTWNECLCIYKLPDISWNRKWDAALQVAVDKFYDSTDGYNEDFYNCYSFVLMFVKNLHHSDFKNVSESKEKFCKKFVVPKMATACRYVLLFRQLNVKEFVVD